MLKHPSMLPFSTVHNLTRALDANEPFSTSVVKEKGHSLDFRALAIRHYKSSPLQTVDSHYFSHGHTCSPPLFGVSGTSCSKAVPQPPGKALPQPGILVRHFAHPPAPPHHARLIGPPRGLVRVRVHSAVWMSQTCAQRPRKGPGGSRDSKSPGVGICPKMWIALLGLSIRNHSA